MGRGAFLRLVVVKTVIQRSESLHIVFTQSSVNVYLSQRRQCHAVPRAQPPTASLVGLKGRAQGIQFLSPGSNLKRGQAVAEDLLGEEREVLWLVNRHQITKCNSEPLL